MFIIKNITQHEVQSLIQKLKDNNNRINQNFGSPNFIVQGHGLAANASFDSALKTLTITVVHKPIYITEKMIENGMNDTIEKFRLNSQPPLVNRHPDLAPLNAVSFPNLVPEGKV